MGTDAVRPCAPALDDECSIRLSYGPVPDPVANLHPPECVEQARGAQVRVIHPAGEASDFGNLCISGRA